MYDLPLVTVLASSLLVFRPYATIAGHLFIHLTNEEWPKFTLLTPIHLQPTLIFLFPSQILSSTTHLLSSSLPSTHKIHHLFLQQIRSHRQREVHITTTNTGIRKRLLLKTGIKSVGSFLHNHNHTGGMTKCTDNESSVWRRLTCARTAFT
jgi:hypothetical protein